MFCAVGVLALSGCVTTPKYSETDTPKLEKQSDKAFKAILACNVKWMNEWAGVRQLPIEKGFVFIENDIGVAMRLTDEGNYRKASFYHEKSQLSIRVFYTKDQFIEKAVQCM
jgi:hypothetical protein